VDRLYGVADRSRVSSEPFSIALVIICFSGLHSRNPVRLGQGSQFGMMLGGVTPIYIIIGPTRIEDRTSIGA